MKTLLTALVILETAWIALADSSTSTPFESSINPAFFQCWEEIEVETDGEVFEILLKNPAQSQTIKYAIIFVSSEEELIAYCFIEDGLKCYVLNSETGYVEGEPESTEDKIHLLESLTNSLGMSVI